MTTYTKDQLRQDLPLLRRVVAELMGWEWYHRGDGRPILLNEKPANPLFIGPLECVPEFLQKAACLDALPNYPESLDACRLFEEGLTEEEQDKLQHILGHIAHHARRYIWQLDAKDHCIAFCCLRGVCE